MKSKFIFFLLIFTTTLSTTNITLIDIEEHKITKQKKLYKIIAKSKKINLEKLKRFKFYNKEKLISNSSYYTDGKFLTQDLDIKFKKAYFLEGKFIMLDSEGIYLENTRFKAKKAIYDRKSLEFKNVFINIDKKKYRKIKYKIKF